MRDVLLHDLVTASAAVGATRSRKAKTAALAAALAEAGADEVVTATSYLSGVLRQRRTGLGWRGLTSLPDPATESTLTVSEVHDAFEEMASLAGAGPPPTSRSTFAAWSPVSFGRAPSTG